MKTKLMVVSYWGKGANKNHIGDFDTNAVLCGKKNVRGEFLPTEVTLEWLEENNTPAYLCQKCAKKAEQLLTQ